MKRILLLVLLQICICLSYAQTPSSSEMKEVIADLKKEIVALEADIKQAEKEDPEAVPGLKTQLVSMKNMLATLDKSKPAPTKSPSSTASLKPISAFRSSPVTPVYLKQPVVAPTASQAKDNFFWYRGKKMNDTTLVTTRGMVVQFSKKREKLIIQPEKKSDPFNATVQEITKGEQRKDAMVDQFDKMKNGFIYYPYVKKALAIYDDLDTRFASAVNNTVSLRELASTTALSEMLPNNVVMAGHGPNAMGLSLERFARLEEAHPFDDVSQKVLLALERARSMFNQLPSVTDFSAPPGRELGICANCDPEMIKRQRKLDSIWTESYHGMEANIMLQVFKATRDYQLSNSKDSADLVFQRSNDLLLQLLKRMQRKDSLLLTRYGDNLEYLNAICPVVLGHERQLQLLGFGDDLGGGIVTEVAKKGLAAYRKYYDEQVGLKNHDFVLNIPFHVGVERQMQLLGVQEGNTGFGELLSATMNYNHFALSLDIDFALERRDSHGDLDLKATGAMTSREKTYIMLVPDSCRFKILPYSVDMSKRKFDDVTLLMEVKSGVKTVREDQGKLVNYPYSGPPSWNLSFPDGRIGFCANAKPDTLSLTGFAGDGTTAASMAGGLPSTRDKYTVDMVAFAGQILITEEPDEKEILDMASNMMNTVAMNMQPQEPGSTLEKLKIQYEGYTNMDNANKGLQGAATTRKSLILFNANNRSTVLTDTYQDSKRKIDDEYELKRGMIHLRIVHEPLKQN